MPATTATKASTPQPTPAAKGAANGAATPSSRPPPPSAAKTAVPPAGGPKKGFTAPPPQPAAAAGAKKPPTAATPASATPAGVKTRATPASGAGLQHGTGGSGYGMNSGFGGSGVMPNSAYGTGAMPPSAYGGSFMQQPGSMGGPAGAGANGSMYGMQYNNGSMYPGVGMSSMYGTQAGGNNGMYSSGYGMNSMMAPAGGGSMYGMGSMGGSGGYGFGSSFGGSLYGGTMYGASGSLYGQGGSLYGSNDPQAIMGSMYGSRCGSIYGGFGSMYSVGDPHTALGTVRKYSMPGFSYTFGSNLGTTPYHRTSFTDGSSYSAKRDNSFRATSRTLRADERDPNESTDPQGLRVTQREKEIEDGTNSRQRGATGADKDGKAVDATSASAARDGAAAANGDGRQPESIMKKRNSVEAPKSPPSTRAAKGGATQAPVLSTDFRIHNVAVLEKDESGAAKVTKKGDACVLDGKSYAMDEVLECAAKERAPLMKSRCIQDMLEHVLAGHNTALLVSDDGKATATATAAVESTVAKLMEELTKPARNTYAGVSASMCGLHSNNMMRDLFADGARPKLMEVGNSPLFGPAIMNATSEPIKSGDDFNKVFEAAMKRGDKETLMVCMLTVKQVRAGAAEGKDDVFLSSVFIGVSRGGPKEFHDIVDKVATSSHDLFRYAVDGPSVCVNVVAVRQTLSEAQPLADCAKIGDVQNTAPRSGNVRRFVDFTEEQLKRMRERSDSATGSEKRELEGHVKRLNLILEDARKLLADPKNTEAKLYRLENEVAATPAAAAAAAATKTTPGAASPKEVGARDGRAAATAAESGAAAASGKARSAPLKDGAGNTATPASLADKPRGTNISTVAIIDGADARAYAVKGSTITAGGRPFVVDEIIQRADVTADAMTTQATDRVLAAFLKGYNGAVVASDSSAVAANGLQSPSLSLVFAAVQKALAMPGSKGVRASIALVRDSGKAADLTRTGDAVADVELASSPLFGPTVHNAELHRVCNQDDLQRLVDKAREHLAAATWDEHCVVHVTIVHCFADKDDVLVSSLLATFATNNSTAYSQVLEQRSSSQSFGDLYRYAFGGAATTAFVVSVGSEDDVADVVNALSTQKTAGAVRNRSPRQGSIKNFITFTTSSVQKRKDQLSTLPADSSERETLSKVIAPMARMLEDHKKVMEDPADNFPRAYATESGTVKDATVSPAPAGAEAAATEKEARATPKSAAAASNATPKTRTVAAAQPSHNQAASAGALTNGSGEDGAHHADPSAAGFTEPRVVVFVGRAVAAEEKKVSLGDKDYAVDEVVHRGRAGATASSTAIAEIQSRFSGVHNCALISASSVTDATSRDEPVWAIFEQCLRSAMAAGKPGEDVRADLTFTVVATDEVKADLLAEEPLAAPRPLEIASSPIYGPRVHGVSTATVLNAEELAHVTNKMHDRVAPHMADIRANDAMMVGTAVVRRRAKDGDVEVASLMGTLTGTSAKAYQEALDKEAVMRRTLLNCAYGGPSATVTILNLSAEDEAAQGMVATAVALSKKQRNLVSRSGSVLAFVKYTEGTMKRELSLAAAATGDSKERHTQKAERLRPVAEDHRRLLGDFTAPIPAYPATRSGRTERDRTPSGTNSPSGATARSAATAPTKAAPSPFASPSPAAGVASTPSGEKRSHGSATPGVKKDGASPNRVHSVVVVTPSRSSAEPGPLATIERVDETHVKAVMDGASHTCECDEAVQRADTASTVRADVLNAAAQQFVGGFNTALLCCDLGGSNAGAVSCVRIVHHAVEAKPANSELYFVLNNVRDGEVRDMLQPGSSYAPMKMANSPVFGPWIHGAEMQPLEDVSEFDAAFNAAVATATKEKAMLVVNLALKAIQDDNGRKDVVVSSLLVTLVADPRAYADLVNTPPKSDRKLFQYAVQGSCFTVGVLGLAGKVAEDGLAECFTVYEKLRAVENRPMRNGSVRRFLAYSLTAAADVKEKLPQLTEERQRAMYEQRLASLEMMITDSRMLLDLPKGRALKVYL